MVSDQASAAILGQESRGTSPCECGHPCRCEDVWFEALSDEQRDEQMYAWHLPLVCAYVLQHRSRLDKDRADGQLRLLQFYVRHGVDALHRLQHHQVRRNKAQLDLDLSEVPDLLALPVGAPSPRHFERSIHDLKRLAGRLS